MDLIFLTTVNQNNYHNMLVKFFWPKVVREDYKNYYFQQDGATPHTSKKAQKRNFEFFETMRFSY